MVGAPASRAPAHLAKGGTRRDRPSGGGGAVKKRCASQRGGGRTTPAGMARVAPPATAPGVAPVGEQPGGPAVAAAAAGEEQGGRPRPPPLPPPAPLPRRLLAPTTPVASLPHQRQQPRRCRGPRMVPPAMKLRGWDVGGWRRAHRHPAPAASGGGAHALWHGAPAARQAPHRRAAPAAAAAPARRQSSHQHGHERAVLHDAGAAPRPGHFERCHASGDTNAHVRTY